MILNFSQKPSRLHIIVVIITITTFQNDVIVIKSVKEETEKIFER